MHWRDTIVLLGIPIDNLTLAGAVEKIAFGPAGIQ